MQVLVKNPLIESQYPLSKVSESFWSEDCLYPEKDFSFSELFLSGPVGLSPYLFLDAKVALLISLLNSTESLYVKNLGALGAIGAHLYSKAKIETLDSSKISRYLPEYLPKDQQEIFTTRDNYDQVMVFGENSIDRKLWDKLTVGGFYILGGTKLEIDLDGTHFEAFGKFMPLGEATEFGWKFNGQEIGLDHFEICKLKKLR